MVLCNGTIPAFYFDCLPQHFYSEITQPVVPSSKWLLPRFKLDFIGKCDFSFYLAFSFSFNFEMVTDSQEVTKNVHRE